MSQLRFNKVSLQFGEHPLLTDLSFSIEKSDRVAVIGRNGAGKSTLLKLIQGVILPDAGTVETAQHLKIAYMQQHPPEASTQTLREFIDGHFDAEHEWDTHQIERVISIVNLNPEAQLDQLSGGQMRRLSLAAALVNDPDILLLDEPTNHLDIETIEWLENFLLKQHITLVLITHDREFMQKIANRIFEIDLARLMTWDGSYNDFLKHKETMLRAEEKAQALFDKKLAQEEAWIRQGIQARRTRNEGRVRALKQMREERSQRQQRQGDVTAQQLKVDYAGKIALEVIDVSHQYADKVIIDNFSATILRGDKIGILGPNGCGKSTLIHILTQALQPTQGTVKHGTQLNIAHFDQHRMQLDLKLTAIDNIADGASHVTINGENKHVISYLQEFLFTPEKARSQVSTFSGGERNRLLLAKVLSQSPNLLILDEPTNDLDMETLDFLEEYLMNYKGTLLLVSHDRAFLDNVVTSTLAFEDGQINAYVGGYRDYVRQRKQQKTKSPKPEPTKKTNKPQKLSYKDQRELDNLPQLIEKLETQIDALQTEMCQSEFFLRTEDVIKNKKDQLQQLESDLAKAYARWEELES